MLVTEPMERSRLVAVVHEAVAGGVNVVQLRDKTQGRQALEETIQALEAHLAGCLLLVNGHPDAAVHSAVTGVHLPADGLHVSAARATVRQDRIVGRSVHSAREATAAAEEGADYLVFGTVFESRSHPDVEPAGVQNLRAVRLALDQWRHGGSAAGSVRGAARPSVIAIGGITPENCGQCIAAGAAGVAVLSGILHAVDPRAAARRYWERLDASAGE